MKNVFKLYLFISRKCDKFENLSVNFGLLTNHINDVKINGVKRIIIYIL